MMFETYQPTTMPVVCMMRVNMHRFFILTTLFISGISKGYRRFVGTDRLYDVISCEDDTVHIVRRGSLLEFIILKMYEPNGTRQTFSSH